MFHVEQNPPAIWLSSQLQALWFGMEKLGFELMAEQRERFSRYLSLLWSESQKINLFSRNDVDRLVNRHILESVGWVKVVGVSPCGNSVDIGSGAGFPGIPLKILFPEINLFLVESISKKAMFLENVVRELALDSVTVLPERAEILGKKEKYHKKFLFGTARAVSSILNIVRWSQPFFTEGGHLFSIKGGNLSDEIKPIKKMVQAKKIKLKIYDYLINFTTNTESVPERKIVDIEF